MAPVALISGAARGIGLACAEHLLGAGWEVVGLDLSASRGLPFPCIEGDAGDELTVVAAVGEAVRSQGRLDGVVSNAGIMVRKPVAELALDEWRRVLDTNLTAAFLLAKHATPQLREARGAMVLIASTRARMSEPDTEAYAASKGGLAALGHALAVSLGPEVRVNVVSPGWIHTKGEPPDPRDHAFHPVGRVGVPADIANLVGWLLGPASGFLTGAELVIDGGVTRKMIYPMSDPLTFTFADDGRIPNSPLPLLVYRQVMPPGTRDAASFFEELFARHGWGGGWRDGIFPFHHFHSTSHEVLGIARGRASVRFGGEAGSTLDVAAGDIVLIPAGVGHKNEGASADLLVVGAYPEGRDYDLRRGEPGEHARAVAHIAAVPLPARDPVTGGPAWPMLRPGSP